MTLCVCTSSPLVSIVVVAGGEVVWQHEQLAEQSVNPILREGLQAAFRSIDRKQIVEFVADLGPGSFIGTRVGVMWVKALAFASGKRCGGLSSFDLVDPESAVLVPNRKYDAFLRLPGKEPELVTVPEPIAIGYGPLIEKAGLPNTYPHAQRVLQAYGGIEWTDAKELRPNYLAYPSTSVPKRQLNLLEQSA